MSSHWLLAAGTLLEDAKIGADLWDRRDEDQISVPK